MKHFRTLSALALLVLAGCAQPLASVNPALGARLTISATAPQRSLVPTLPGLTYDLTLTNPGQTPVVQVGSASPSFSLPLLVGGTWTAQVDARSGGAVVASGSASKTLGPGDAATLVVPLVFTGAMVTGTGGVSLLIDASAAPGVAAATWSFTNPSGTTTTPGGTATFSALTQTIAYGLAGMVAGTWTLNITFFADAAKTLPVATLHETLLVLNGSTAYPPIVLTANDFNTPGQPALVAITGGTFIFGLQQTTVSSFLMGKYPVTQAQFQTVMGFNPSYFDNSDTGVHANPEAPWSPVEQVSLWDAMEYCNRLSRASGLDPVYTLTAVSTSGTGIIGANVATDLSRNGYRLPTDAEWEYAARAGTTTNFSWGNGADSAGAYSWSSNSSAPSGGRPHGVGQKLANAWGLYDMFGNVQQWMTTWYEAIPQGPLLDYAGPVSPSAGAYSKNIRGASFADPYLDPNFSVDTQNYSLVATGDNLGFRVVRRLSVNPQTLAAGRLDDGVGELDHVQAATDAAGGWIVSGGTGLYTGAADTGLRRLLLSRVLPSGAFDPTFGASGTVRPLPDPYTQGAAAGFSQDPLTHLITIQGPWYDASLTRYGDSNHSRFNILFQFSPTGVAAVSANFPANGGVQEDHFFTDTDDGFDSSWQFHRHNFPVRDSVGNLYSLGHRPETGGDQAGIQRLHPDGSVENTFWSATSFGPNLVHQSLGIFPNPGPHLDKVLVAGLYPTTSSVLVRINTDGTEDAEFGSAGRVTFADGVLSNINSVRIDGQDRIYLVGYRHPVYGLITTEGVVARLLPDGTPDNSFGSSGFYVLPHPFDVPRDLAIDEGGRTVVVGETQYNHATPGFVLRVLAEGSGLDATLGEGGFQLLTKGYGGSARSVAIDGRGKIGVAGFVNNPGFVPQGLGAGPTTATTDTTPAFWVF